MEETSSKKTLLIFGSIIVTTVLLFGGVFVLLSGSSDSKNGTQNKASVASTDSKGNQVIELTAKTGYTPKVSTAQANKPITLRVSTKGTYDCSSGVNIAKLGISKQLPADGTTDIQIPSQTAGTTINGTCSMGMYNFQITIS
jgi:plastocyanin domain-containing protein